MKIIGKTLVVRQAVNGWTVTRIVNGEDSVCLCSSLGDLLNFIAEHYKQFEKEMK